MADEMRWFDIREWGVEGKGWTDTHCAYDRLPRKAEQMVPEAVWNLSRTATGMCVHFTTNATAIHARWVLRSPQLGEANFAVCGFSGLDLYADDNGTWRWAGATQNVGSQTPCVCLVNGMAGALRKYRLYLPLRNPVDRVEIGVPAGSVFEPVAPRTERPLVFYGTSIVHGAYASHSGLVHSEILGRRLNRPTINLGFSGTARMELALADLLAELDAAVYIVDTLPNMDMSLVTERAEAFVRRLRGHRPTTPIVLVEDRPLVNYWIKPAEKRYQENKWREFRRIHDMLVASGIGGLSYIEGRDLFGTDSEASLDSSHPSDLGFMRMADCLEPVLRGVLAGVA